jgi:NAD+ synthase
MNKIRLPSMDCKTVCREIGDFVIQTVREASATGCIIGLSGGVDSSTTAALIQHAFAAKKTPEGDGYELVGYIIPSSVNLSEDARDAETVAQALGIRYEIVPIDPIIDSFRLTNPEAFKSVYHRGNMISRIRANVLSTKAATERKVLAGTGNKDEDFGIGYYTLFGDGAVHMSPISGLSKRLVREVGAFLGLPEKIVQRIPTAGLEPEQNDFKDLGYDYDLVELVSEGFAQGWSPAELAGSKQVKALAEAQMERYRTLFNRSKFSNVDEVVADIEKRHRAARMKMKIIHPPSPQITLVY